MKRKFRNLLSVILAVTVIFSCAVPAFAATTTYENDLPVVYVKGAGREIYSADGKQIMPFETEPENEIMAESDRLIAAFSASVLAKDWDMYCDELVEVISEVYKDVVLDNNGEATDGSYIIPSPTPKKKTSNFYLSDYIFNYDSRLDPVAVADQMEAYINSVLKATGKSKVQLVGRCLGGNYVAAYLTKYGCKKVDTCVLYVPSTLGTVVCSGSFSGNFVFDADVINDYVANMDASDDDMTSMIQSIVSVTHSVSLLATGTDLVESVYEQIADMVVPRLLIASYATMPAYWSMVDDENYEEAKRFIFGDDIDLYSGLVEKIDEYHYGVRNIFDQTLKNLTNSGMKIAIIAKYNTALPPIFENSRVQADGTIELSNLSFGATSADLGKTLSKSYLDELKYGSAGSGALDYVSNDLIVDASTCLYPDNTWFIKNSLHEDFATSINRLIYEVIRSKKQLTVWDREEYPQFMVYNSNNTLSEVEEAEPNGSTGDNVSFFESIKSFFSKFFAFFKNFFNLIF